MKCTTPPLGWKCSREAGHEGPCAAMPTKTSTIAKALFKPVRALGVFLTLSAMLIVFLSWSALTLLLVGLLALVALLAVGLFALLWLAGIPSFNTQRLKEFIEEIDAL